MFKVQYKICSKKFYANHIFNADLQSGQRTQARAAAAVELSALVGPVVAAAQAQLQLLSRAVARASRVEALEATDPPQSISHLLRSRGKDSLELPAWVASAVEAPLLWAVSPTLGPSDLPTVSPVPGATLKHSPKLTGKSHREEPHSSSIPEGGGII